MFTGIIEQLGLVIANRSDKISNRLIVKADLKDLKIGESIAINGVCLTLLPSEDNFLHFDVSPETLEVTTLIALKANDVVNVERAMQMHSRFGGHYVSGHVDTRAHIRTIKELDTYRELILAGFTKDAFAYLMPKGSITVDGVSLTINAVNEDSISLMLVPHTLAQTTLGAMTEKQLVNIEFDYLTRVVAHQLARFTCEVHT